MGIYYNDIFGFGFNSLIMTIMMFIFWIGFIFFIVWLVKQSTNYINNSESDVKTNSATDILKERYAKGEIDKKEYEERKKVLEK